MTTTVIRNRTYVLTPVADVGVELHDSLGRLSGRVRITPDEEPVVVLAPRGWNAGDRSQMLAAAATAGTTPLD